MPEPTWICVQTEGADFDFSLVRTRVEAQELVEIELADNPELTLAELCTGLYTADQMRQVLEQAAQVCDKQHDKAFTQAGAARADSCAEAIRAMIKEIPE
jgi:hypothetical protein